MGAQRLMDNGVKFGITCALVFVRKHSLGISWSNGWPRTWYGTRCSIGNAGAITS